MAKNIRRPMTLLMISPLADTIHMALMIGATTAAIGRPVTYFFSKSAIKFLTEGGWDQLKSSDGATGPEMDATLESKGVADSALLLDGLNALDVRFVACETAIREHDIDVTTLVKRPAVEISGLADILEKGEGGDWLTF
ncbi:MAG: DsrE family protein [Kordiimonadaceae bacterium]|nr:DsrE family protein [Kordiimonadaceae bacterium]